MSEKLRDAAEHLYEAACLFEFEDLDPDDPLAVVQACFTRSDCDDFAFSLNRLTGWEIVRYVWLDPDGDPSHHTLNRRSDGSLVDIMGSVTERELRRRYRIGKDRDLTASVVERPGDPFSTGDPIEDFERVLQIITELPYAPFPEIAAMVDIETEVERFDREMDGPTP